ncbi:DUF11 domain-containing protein [Methylobacillus arboreus]|uniref:SdrD B-like domain-containing protein n=1 Tax=Methylobacillus arboreus TaxID=755170 RepID=UPI001E56BA1C|nr:SdrD B-like domain-containing protein [Methylobacillus arboreus]MCB5190603.1 DUF11 domain-containing protein [Methylobacillus arboreus]
MQINKNFGNANAAAVPFWRRVLSRLSIEREAVEVSPRQTRQDGRGWHLLRALLLSLSMVAAAPALADVDVLIANLSDSPDPAPRGGDITYTIVVANNASNPSNDPASDVTVTVPLPATTLYQEATMTNGTCPASVPAGGNIVCTLNSPLVGGTTTTVILKLRTTAVTGDSINISASVATSTAESNGSNNTESQNTTINNGADLQINAVGSPGTVVGGGNVTWTIDGINNGPNAAINPAVTITLPDSLTFVAAGSGGGGFNCSASGQNVTCTSTSPLADGATFSGLNIVTRANVDSGTVTVTPRITSSVADPFPLNNDTTVSVLASAGADLSITQSEPSPSPAHPGDAVTFTLHPANLGPSNAPAGVTATYTLPAGFTYTGATPEQAGWACPLPPAGPVITCTYAGSFNTARVDTIRIVATAPAATQLDSYTGITATIANNDAALPDPDPANNTSIVDLNVLPEGAGLYVSKSRSPNPVAAGQEVTNTITVENQGSSAAPANTIIVTDTINIADETFVRYDASNGWSCTPAGTGGGNSLDASVATVSCSYTNVLAAGQTASPLRIITKVNDSHVGGVANNTAEVDCAGGATCWYPRKTIGANVTITQLADSVNLAMAKAVTTANGDSTLDANESVMTYTLTVTNNGTVDATGIVVRDPIPGHRTDTPNVAAATMVSTASSATFNCTMDNAALVCTQSGGSLLPGEQVVFTVPVERNLNGGSDLRNTASVRSSTQGDLSPGNNSASVDVAIVPLADVEMVSKISTPATGEAGTNFTYVLTFRNNGPSPAQNVSVTDSFTIAASDPGFTVIAVNPSAWSSGAPNCSGLDAGQSYGAGSNPVLTCQGGNLNSGEQQTVQIVVRPNWKSGQASGETWTINNTAHINTSTVENIDGTDGGNNSKAVQLTVEVASIDLLVNNIDNVDPLGYDPSNDGDNPQNDVIYTINMVNNGPSLATGLQFTYAITPPAGKTVRFLGDSASMGPPSNSICNNIGSEVTGPNTLTVTCAYSGLQANIANGETRNRYLSVRMLDAPPPTGDVYNSVARVSANENDRNSSNDQESEATSVRNDIQQNNFSLAGRVYSDINDNGVIDPGELGIGGSTITLSGTTEDGQNVCDVTPSCVVQTNADGSYIFTGLPRSNAAGYTIVQTQPAGYNDGKDQVGNLGEIGSPDHGGGGDDDRFTVLLTASATGYNFGESAPVSGTANLSGHVWIDGNHDRVFDSANASDRPQAGWLVELLRNGNLIATVTTDANGAYSFSNLSPGTGYQVRFLHPNGTVYGHARPNEQGLPYDNGQVSPANPAGASNLDGGLSGIILAAGDNITQHSLPIDPAGVVYDAVTRQPVAGAVVTIRGPAGFTPASDLVTGNASQTTGPDGIYQFLLNPSAPAGVYTLEVTSYPANYIPQPSGMIPVCNATLQVASVLLGGADPAMMQQNDGAPAVGIGPHDPAACATSSADGSFANSSGALAAAATRYYFNFTIGPDSADLINNHIPLDPIMGGIVRIVKTTPLVNVVRGDLVPYTITATSAVAISNIVITDRLPPGFKYRSGSASVNGVRIEPDVSGRDMTWINQSFAAGETKTFKLILVVGTGVGEGEYVNQAWAQNALVNTLVSNIGSATVKVTPDPTFDCSDIIGKVFDDKNANGYQDQGEPGIANVRVVTARGLLVTTDAEGRFHVTCADIPNMDRGANFVMKLDERTLPSGYRVTTENPRDVRVTRGKMVKLNFGATVHRVVRLDLNDEAFVPNGTDLQPQWHQAFADMVKQLDGRPSVLRIAYDPGGGGEKLAKKRLDSVAKAARKLWHDAHKNNKDEAAFPLIIETAVEVQP